MADTLFPELIQLRTEPFLRQALNDIARAECTSTSEFIRRELRLVVARYSFAHAVKGGFALRVATPDDVVNLGLNFPEGMPWVGTTITLRGEPVGIGAVFWDATGRAWIAVTQREPIPPAMFARVLDRMIADLHAAGGKVLHALADPDFPEQPEILQRLGFVPTTGIVPDREVWVLSPLVTEGLPT
ncbi:hypothetical protein [uncultured Enterovirga sp.]|uniref:hypothetical protein n=1 Tax=uncultured Enterovirga sp. TaxID=2026352 RepID=UPI0035CA052B